MVVDNLGVDNNCKVHSPVWICWVVVPLTYLQAKSHSIKPYVLAFFNLYLLLAACRLVHSSGPLITVWFDSLSYFGQYNRTVNMPMEIYNCRVCTLKCVRGTSRLFWQFLYVYSLNIDHQRHGQRLCFNKSCINLDINDFMRMPMKQMYFYKQLINYTDDITVNLPCLVRDGINNELKCYQVSHQVISFNALPTLGRFDF